MPIKTCCPYCGNEAKIRDELDCKKIKCPGCKKPYVVGEDEDKQPCPSCDALMAKDGFLCVACGYNQRTGQTLQTSKPVDTKKARKKFLREESGAETAAIKIQYLFVAPALALAGGIGVGLASRGMVAGGIRLVSLGPFPPGFIAIIFTCVMSLGWHVSAALGVKEWSEEGANSAQRQARASLRWLMWGMLLVSAALAVFMLRLFMPAVAWQLPANW